MSEGNFIVLLRKITEWEWYTDVPTKTLFLHLLLKANFKPNKWQGQTIKRGELITSVSSLAEQTGLSIQQVRTALNKLKSTNEISVESTNKFTLVKVHNYGKYQDYDKAEQQTNNKQITNKQQSNNNTITKKQRNKETSINITSEQARAYTREKKEAALKNCPNVLLTDKQFETLLERMSVTEFNTYCENLQEYIDNGHKVHSCYQTICRWAERDNRV